MPGNTVASPLARRRAVRFSRSSSFTWRVRKRSSEKLLRRRSPSVRGRLLMKGTPTNKTQTIIRAVAQARFGRRPSSEDLIPKTKDPLSPRVPVAPGLLARPRRAPQIWKNAFQICRHGLHALALRTHGEQFLLEIKVERQRSRQ